MSQNTNTSVLLVVRIVIAITSVGAGFIVLNLPSTNSEVSTSVVISSSTNSSFSNSSSLTSTSKNSSTSEVALAYKNGSYSVDTTYARPGGNQQFTVKVLLENDKIISVNTTTTTNEMQSEQYIESFNNGISAQVVGKKIDEVSSSSLGIVSGASLTTNSFLKALETVKSSAK